MVKYWTPNPRSSATMVIRRAACLSNETLSFLASLIGPGRSTWPKLGQWASSLWKSQNLEENTSLNGSVLTAGLGSPEVARNCFVHWEVENQRLNCTRNKSEQPQRGKLDWETHRECPGVLWKLWTMVYYSPETQGICVHRFQEPLPLDNPSLFLLIPKASAPIPCH